MISPNTPKDEHDADPPSSSARVDPEDGDLPPDAVFACAYTVLVMPFDYQEAAFFRRTASADELWVTQSPFLSFDDQVSGPRVSLQRLAGTRNVEVACDVSGPVQGDPRSACLTLLAHLIRGRVGFYWPGKFITSGIVSKLDFNGLVDGIERELDGNAEKARQNEPEIVKVARELGLDPSPTGKGPDSWKARCPGTNHPIYINAPAEKFGCGWCKRKGSPEDLRAFVAERNRRR